MIWSVIIAFEVFLPRDIKMLLLKRIIELNHKWKNRKKTLETQNKVMQPWF